MEKTYYDMVKINGSQTKNLGDDDGIGVGKHAKRIVLDADRPIEAIRRRPIVRYVISKGKLLVQRSVPQIQWHGVEIISW